ncbi:hypothetical protein [Desulfotignum phosphitoxidans]|uniref:hypothetical protein n=1 Tax=Desulfotignum phosphitoxidans TaxID=190898 RepID=UPI0005865220|nr:hypothetical protein [Desulfotignum phosphitoxidans]
MRVLIKNTDLAGKPLEGEGEVFTGKTSLEIVRAMKGAALFSDQGSFEDYIDMLLRNAKMLAGIDLVVKGESPEEKADSLLAVLIDHGLAVHPAAGLERKPGPPRNRDGLAQSGRRASPLQKTGFRRSVRHRQGVPRGLGRHRQPYNGSARPHALADPRG